MLVADYRLYPEVRFPDFLADSAQALAYGMDHAPALGADPRRVFVVAPAHALHRHGRACRARDRASAAAWG